MEDPKSGCYYQYAAREKVADWIITIHRWGYYGEEYDNADQLVSENETMISICKSKRQVREYDIRLLLVDRVFLKKSGRATRKRDRNDF